MTKTKIYLCGPIAGCNDSEAHDWRDWFKEQVEDRVGDTGFGHQKGKIKGWAECLDPMRRDYRGAGLSDNDEGRMPWWVVKEIVELDKIDIAQSDVLLANMLPDKSKTGSNMEIIYAWELGKLVVIVHDPKKPVSPWHRYHAQKIVATLEEARDYIKNGNWRREKVFA